MGKANLVAVKGIYRHEMKLMYLNKNVFNKFGKDNYIYKFSMLKDGQYYYFNVFSNRTNDEYLSRKQLIEKTIYTVNGFVDKKISFKDDKQYINYNILLSDYIK